MNIETAVGQCSISREFLSLGTLNRIQVYDRFENQRLDEAIQRVYEIDDKMSAFNPESEVSLLNRAAGREPVSVSEETLSLLTLAKEIGRLSGGAFDVTVRPLVELWGINRKADFIPEPPAIEKVRRLVDDTGLVLDASNHTAYLSKEGQAVDLGGIAKGYAADEARRVLTQGGVKSALVNLGGNIVAIGSRPCGGPWRIGVQDPVSMRGEYFGTLAVTDKTVVTSGSNEQFFIKDGSRYHHILDPRTGRPAQSGLLSVTAVGASSAMADALTTAVFVLGMEKGRELLKEQNVEAIFATEDYKIYLTEGLVGQFMVNKGHCSGRSN